MIAEFLKNLVSEETGWKGLLALLWVAAMALDYLSGSAAAMKNGSWSSTTAREGIWHKGGMILVVLVSALADCALGTVLANAAKLQELQALHLSWPGAVLPLVLVWYIITELGSVLENAVKLGATVPAWLADRMQSISADTAAELFSGQTGESRTESAPDIPETAENEHTDTTEAGETTTAGK